MWNGEFMKKIIGYLKNITKELFAKDLEGHLRTLQAGDAVYEGEVVVDANGERVADALRMVKEDDSEQSSGEENVESSLHGQKSEHNDNSRSTTSTDDFDREYAERDINAPLRENRFNSGDFWLQNSGLVRESLEGEVDINAPLREFYFPEREFTPSSYVSAQSQEIVLQIVSTDAQGNRIDAVSIPEGGYAYYMVIAVDANGKEVPTVTGYVDVAFSDGTALRSGSAQEGTLDFSAQNATVMIGEVFSAQALDDYIADGNETFYVQIVEGTFTQEGAYGSVTYPELPVETVIVDNSTEATPQVEENVEGITLRLVATDRAGHIINPVTIAEGEEAYYKVILVDPQGHQIVGATGNVNIVFSDVSAVRTGDTASGTLDYSASNASVALNQVFSAQALDDYLSDSAETFNVSLVAGSYTQADNYETVIYDTRPVTTTIIDDTGTPNESDDGSEATEESVIIKLVALDEAGNPILDENGEYTTNNLVHEGNDANYMALAFTPGETVFSPETKLDIQEGTIDVTFSDGTENPIALGENSQSAIDGTQDYNNTAQSTVTLGTVISTEAFDDYFSDNNETFTIAMTDGSYAPDENGGYENVTIDTDAVTTTIKDDSGTEDNDANSLDDEEADSQNAEESQDVVQIKLVACDGDGNPILDGENYTFENDVVEDEAAYYMALAFDPDATEYTTATVLEDANQIGKVSVTTSDLDPAEAVGISGDQSATDGSEDYSSTSSQVVTLNEAFSVDTLDDYLADNGERFEIAIDESSYEVADDGASYENVTIDTNAVTTTIKDDEGTPNDQDDGVESDHESVIIKLVALDENEEPILDADGNYTFANEVIEGESSHYMALAFTPEETVFSPDTKLENQLGTIDVTFGDESATGSDEQSAIDGSEDYNNTAQSTVTLGTVITTDAFDDYLADNEEQFTISISDGSYAQEDGEGYENVDIDTNAVTTTIKDGSDEGDSANQEIDTVYVQLYTDATQEEADDTPLTHTLKLVDKDGNEVMLPEDETVTVNLVYADDDTASDDDFDGGKVTTVTITGDGGSTYSFSNIIVNDDENEGTESYAVSIDSVTSTYFENMEADSDNNGAIGTIEENVELEDDAETLLEGNVTIDDESESMNLLDNDETGDNGKIVKFSYTDEEGETQEVDLVDGKAEDIDTQYGTVSIYEDGTWRYTSDQTEDNLDGVEDVITYTLEDDLGKTGTADFTLTVTDTNPSVVTEDSILDEDDLDNGSDEDKESLSVTKSLDITKGADDIADVTFDDNTISGLEVLEYTSAGEALSYDLIDAHTIQATANGNDVFKITLDNPTDATGESQSYTFELQGVIDHPEATDEDVLDFTFSFNLLDTDSTVSGNSFVVSVIDDVPTAVEDATQTTTEGSGEELSGNVLVGDEDGENPDIQGADSAKLKAFTYIDSATGDFVTEDLSDGEDHTVTTPTGELTVNEDGSWRFTAVDSFDHDERLSGDDEDHASNGTFTYTLIDADGDESVGTQVIDVLDGADPQNDGASGSLDEDDLESGSDGSDETTISGDLAITSGTDALDVTFSTSGSGTLSSNGVDITYELSDDGHTLTGKAGDVDVFIATITDPDNSDSTGFTFELLAQLDHPENADGQASEENSMDVVLEYTALDIDGDSATNTLTIDVTDDVPTLSDGTSSSVDEDDLAEGSDGSESTTVTGTLELTQGADTTDVTFDVEDGSNSGITSGGDAIYYYLSNDSHRLTASTAEDSDSITDDNTIYTVDVTTPESAEPGYSFTLNHAIDHDEGEDENSLDIAFDVKVTDFDGDSDTAQFVVTVVDDVPFIPEEIETPEDNVYAWNAGADAADMTVNEDPLHGTVTYNDETKEVIYTPDEDYSGPDSFNITITDADGDETTQTVEVTVTPVADAPEMQDDLTVSTQEDTNNEDEGGDVQLIGLELPEASKDDTDQSDEGSDDNDDAPERIGLINFDFSDPRNDEAEGAKVMYDSDGDGTVDTELLTLGDASFFSIKITDVENYHPEDLEEGDFNLTQAQYESISVNHAEDNAENIYFEISTVSHEVDGDGNLWDPDIVSDPEYQNVVVDVTAVTDAITLEWDNKLNGGDEISTTDNENDTYTFSSAIDEDGDEITIDLKSMMTQTSGFENDESGDLDGSELRSYTVEGVPEGTILRLGSATAVASTAGVATVYFADNTVADPDFTITIGENYSGSIDGAKLTLSSVDTDSDSDVEPETVSASLYFSVDIDAVADNVTLQVAQAIGDEDAGRSTGNSANDADASNIDDAANGIDLEIKVTSDDNKDIEDTDHSTFDEKESYTITIDSIPSGGAIYYSDANGTVLVDENGVIEGSNDNVSVTDNDGTWEIEITSFDNDAPLKFVPPHNSDADYLFNVSAYSVDSDDTSPIETLQIDVTVEDVADVPVNDDLAEAKATDVDDEEHEFNIVSVEDGGGIVLRDALSTPDELASYDSDGSEGITSKITNLAEEFTIEGATFIGGTGTSRIWLVDMSTDDARLITPENYSGEVSMDLYLSTTEVEGDSKTHPVETITVMVTPVAEAVVNTSDEQNEDEDLVLNFDIDMLDADESPTQGGSEALATFAINMGTVPEGVTLVGSVSGELSGDDYVYLDVTEDGVLETVTATLAEDSHMDGTYSFDIKYTIEDTTEDSEGNTYVNTRTVEDETYTVVVNAVTDEIALEMSAKDMEAGITADTEGNISARENGSFTQQLDVTGVDSDGRGDIETDSSELFTRVMVTGLPEGITVIDGEYAGDTGAGNYSGIWYVDIEDDALDDDGATYDLVFDIDGAFSEGDEYEITVTTYNEDANNGTEESAEQSFTLSIDADLAGDEPGDPAEIEAFYQDIDQDGTQDHDNGNMEDEDAYDESVIREDVRFALSDVVYVNTDGSSEFTLRLEDVQDGVLIEGMTYNEEDDVYILSGDGDETAVVNALQSILVTPVLNENTDANDILGSDLSFNVVLTTYATGGASNTEHINFTASVLPVTDEMDLTIVNDGITEEDTAQTFSITLDNASDGENFSLVDGKVYLQMTETFADTNDDGSDGDVGTLVYNDETLVLEDVSGVNGIEDGEYYVISDVSEDDVLEITYNPAENRDGHVDVDVYVRNIESEDWDPYDTEEMTSIETISFDITPVEDGFSVTTVDSNSEEDTMTQLEISSSNPDNSELLTSISLSSVPTGFTVFYGDDEESAQMALNVGVDGTAMMEMTYGEEEEVDTNLWSIPTDEGDVPAYIGIKAPENWSGDLPQMTLVTVSEMGTETSNDVNVTVDPVVDALTINATQTFGDEGEMIDLKLNTNIEDLDGSETVTLTLAGLGENAYFTANEVGIESDNVSYDLESDTYTITNIDPADINALAVTQSAMSGTIDITATMVESDGTTSDTVEDSFDIDITEVAPTSGADALFYDGEAIDALEDEDSVTLQANQDIDFAGTGTPLANIETIDLRRNGDHVLANISVADVTRMTDEDETLVIEADDGDTINLTDEWTKDGNEYTSGSTTVTINGGTVTTSSTIYDGIIGGLEYTTSSGITGLTQEDGSFTYGFGDSVVFSIGSVVIGEIDTNEIKDNKVFLQDLAGTERTDVNNEYVENMAVLLQSLDVDGDAYNGIVITEAMRDAFSSEDFDLATISESELTAIIEETGNEVVSEAEAMEHVTDVLVSNTELEADDFDVRVETETVEGRVTDPSVTEGMNVTSVRNSESASSSMVGAAIAGMYGSLLVAEDGSYVYTLDEEKVEALSIDERVEEHFEVTFEDGSTKAITIEVHHSSESIVAQTLSSSSEEVSQELSSTVDDAQEVERIESSEDESEDFDDESSSEENELDEESMQNIAGVLTFEETIIDFANIEMHGEYDLLDLTINGDHHLLNLGLEDVLDLTGGDHTLLIETDAGDSVELVNEGDNVWEEISDNLFENSDGTQVRISGAGSVAYESHEENEQTTEDEEESQEFENDASQADEETQEVETATESEESLEDILPEEEESEETSNEESIENSTSEASDYETSASDPTVLVTVDDQVPEVG